MNSRYVCAFSIDKKIKVINLMHIYNGINDKNLEIRNTKVMQKFTNHEDAIFYDTENSNIKILCAKKKDINEVECIGLCIFSLFSRINFDILEYNILNRYQTSFSYQEDNCNFTNFNNEYLLCCGKNNYIFCSRRDMDFNLIKNFSINISGIISNLTFENDLKNNIKIIYSNKINDMNNIYEYFNYPPVCKNTNITTTSYQAIKINFPDLVERKTNTNYYISFDNIPNDIVTLRINDKQLNNNDKILIEGDNYLYIISKDESEIKGYPIDFNISIEETYSINCQILLNIETCYNSCKTCSKSIHSSNYNEHNCIE